MPYRAERYIAKRLLILLIVQLSVTFDLGGLGERVDNEYIRSLEADPEQAAHAPNHSPREVSSGHFVLVRPTPLSKPRLVTYSPEVCTTLLGLDESECRSELFVKLFSGGDVEDEIPGFSQQWATPYALSIYGQEIKPDGAGPRGYGYGDGRAISIGEVRIEGEGTDDEEECRAWAHAGECAKNSEFMLASCRKSCNVSTGSTPWELQLKGSGKTPFCRGSDGRAVLRSSLREFVASETMAALGVPTTRALSLVVSADERVQRAWYTNKSAAIAIGAIKRDKHGGDVVRAERVAITTRVARSFLRVGQFELYGRRASRREPDGLRQLEQLARHALRREYPEVLGPATCTRAAGTPLQVLLLEMARKASARFARLSADWIRVGYTQSNFNADNCLVGGVTLDYGPFGFIERYDPGWGMWVGSGDHFSFMNQPRAAGRNLQMFLRSLEPLVDAEGIAELRYIVQRSYEADMERALGEMWASKLGLPPHARARATRLWRALAVLMQETTTDWTIFWRQLAQVADAAAEGVRDEATHLTLLAPAFYTPPADQDPASRWMDWLRDWLSELDVEDGRMGAGARMRLANPKFVPREWMLVEAYTAAEKDDYGPLRTLLALLGAPYEEHPKLSKHFYHRAPVGVEWQGGIGFMS